MVLLSNFDKLKDDFKRDTKLSADENIALYIHYYNARINDFNAQYSEAIRSELIVMNGKLSDFLKKQG